MESLDKEVGLLRNKLQRSIRANPKRSSSLFSFRTSTQKRKWKKVQGVYERILNEGAASFRSGPRLRKESGRKSKEYTSES